MFARDPASGELHFVEARQDTAADALARPRDLAISPDGAHLYAISRGDNALAVLGRNADTGRLTPIDQLADPATGIDGLVGLASALTLSPDGAQLYVTSLIGAVAVLARDAGSGRLSVLEAHRDGENGIAGLAAATDVVVSPDGADVYALGRIGAVGDAAVTVFRRDLAPEGSPTRVASSRD